MPPTSASGLPSCIPTTSISWCGSDSSDVGPSSELSTGSGRQAISLRPSLHQEGYT